MRSKNEVLCAAASRLDAERSQAYKPDKAHKTIFAPNNIYVKLTQVAKNHFAFATALLWHWSFEITLKLYLYGKYSTQTMIFWSLCASIWFKNMKKMLLQMTSGFLQLESTIDTIFSSNLHNKLFKTC
jgi:hypothetical protein